MQYTYRGTAACQLELMHVLYRLRVNLAQLHANRSL